VNLPHGGVVGLPGSLDRSDDPEDAVINLYRTHVLGLTRLARLGGPAGDGRRSGRRHRHFHGRLGRAVAGPSSAPGGAANRDRGQPGQDPRPAASS